VAVSMIYTAIDNFYVTGNELQSWVCFKVPFFLSSGLARSKSFLSSRLAGSMQLGNGKRSLLAIGTVGNL